MKSIRITSKYNRNYSFIGGIFGVIYITLLLVANNFNMTNFNGLFRIVCVSVITFYLLLGKLSPITLLAFLGLLFLDFKSLFGEIIIEGARWPSLLTYFSGSLLGTLSLYTMTDCLKNEGVVNHKLTNVTIGISIVSIIIAFVVAGYHTNVLVEMSVGISLMLHLVFTPLCLLILLILINMFTILWLSKNDKNVEEVSEDKESILELDILLKYKELLDQGIISDEEFALKKEELFK